MKFNWNHLFWVLFASQMARRVACADLLQPLHLPILAVMHKARGRVQPGNDG